jgi:hypothetical protein
MSTYLPCMRKRRLGTPNRQPMSSQSAVRHAWDRKYAYGYTHRIFDPPVGMTTRRPSTPKLVFSTPRFVP